MVRYIIILFSVLLLVSCGTSTKATRSSKRGLMLLEITDLPQNAKFVSPRYQQKLKKSMKKHHRDTKTRYKRAGR